MKSTPVRPKSALPRTILAWAFTCLALLALDWVLLAQLLGTGIAAQVLGAVGVFLALWRFLLAGNTTSQATITRIRDSWLQEKRLKVLAGIFAAALAALASAVAYEQMHVKVTVHVIDSEGTPVPGAMLRLLNLGGHQSAAVLTVNDDPLLNITATANDKGVASFTLPFKYSDARSVALADATDSMDTFEIGGKRKVEGVLRTLARNPPYAVSYYELDAFSAHLMMAGALLPSYQKLFGDDLLVAQTAVSRHIFQFLSTHSAPTPAGYHISVEHSPAKTSGRQPTALEENAVDASQWISKLSEATRKKLRWKVDSDGYGTIQAYFDGSRNSEVMFWPELDIARRIRAGKELPADFIASYFPSESHPGAQGTQGTSGPMFVLPVLRKPLTLADFADYEKRGEQFFSEERAAREREERGAELGPRSDDLLTRRELESMDAGQRAKLTRWAMLPHTKAAISMVRSLGAGGPWPQGLINGVVHPEAHSGIAMQAMIPELRVIVAVVSNLSAKPITFDAAVMRQATLSKVTDEQTTSRMLAATAATRARLVPSGALAPKQNLLIPLGLAMRARHPLDWYDDVAEANAQAAKAFEAVKAAARLGPINFVDEGGNLPIPATEAGLWPNEPLEPRSQRPWYRAGVQGVIDRVELNGIKQQLRAYDRSALVARMGIDAGSCPFVHVRIGNSPMPLSLGTILDKSNGPSREASEALVLPKGTTHVEISELEPETTYLRYVAIEYTLANDSKRTLQLLGAQNARHIAKVLRPGEKFRHVLPGHLLGAREVRLVVQGYYTRDEAIASTR